jgi:hypothetical protein
VTSHSSQGATADRVMLYVDTGEAHENLVNSRLAYVAVSRARYDAQIYTNDAANLLKTLSREVSHAAAVEDWNLETGAATGDRRGVENNHGDGARGEPRVRHGGGGMNSADRVSPEFQIEALLGG